MELIPTILTDDPKEIAEKIHLFESLVDEDGKSVVSRLHIDIADGELTQGKTIPLEVLENIETPLVLDIHLMVEEPIDWVERAIRAMGERIIGQIEMMTSQPEFVGKVTEAGLRVGLAIDIDTPVSSLDSAILKDVDAVLVMGRKAGFGEYPFDETALDKVKELISIREGDATPFKILLDGGVGGENVEKIKRVGVDEICVGHAFEELMKNTW